MAPLQKTRMSYLLLCLALCQSSGHFTQLKNCFERQEPVTAKCGATAMIQCKETRNITQARVMPHCPKTENHCSQFICATNCTSPNGRFQLTISGSIATLRIHQSKLSDAGSYKWYLPTESSNNLYSSDLNIEGPSESPHISLNRTDMKIVCEVVGGCPVGQIEWSDGHGTNWTKSAISPSEEKAGILRSVLPLERSSIMGEYCCSVTYQLMNKTENKSKCISSHSVNGEASTASERTRTSNALYILVPIAMLTAGTVAVVIHSRKRRRHQEENLSQAHLIMNGTEMPTQAESNGDTSHFPVSS